MNKRVCKEDQIRLIMECRQSGLSDYQWCEKNGVYPGTFYNWVSKLRKSGYTFPDSEARSNAIPARQDIVKVDVVSCQEPSPVIEQNVSLSTVSEAPTVVAELLIGDVTLRLFNGADEQLIQNVLRCIGGAGYAW